jgi:hypothetical protein
MSLDIDEVRQLLKQHIHNERRARGVQDVKELSAGEAVKFLKGNS